MYNKTKGGVDTLNQMFYSYSTARGTLSLPSSSFGMIDPCIYAKILNLDILSYLAINLELPEKNRLAVLESFPYETVRFIS